MPLLFTAPALRLLAALLLLLPCVPASAAGDAPSIVPAAGVRAYAIAPGALGQALRQFAGVAGILLSADGRLTLGKNSPGLHGTVGTAEGLRQLLAGSGLQAVPLDDGSYVLRQGPAPASPVPAGQPPPQRMPALTVRAAADGGYAGDGGAAGPRSNMPLGDTPQAASVIGAALIGDQAMRSMADALRQAPGVGTAQGEGNRDTAVFRGNSSTSDFYLDGIRDDAQYYRDFYNTERVEVLKGPNAMLFGRGGSGGIVNRVAKQPEWRAIGEATLSAGAWRNRRASVDAGRAVSADLAVRVNALLEQGDAFRDYVTLRRAGVSPALAWRPGARTSVVVSAEHFRDTRTTDRGFPSLNGKPYGADRATFFGNPDASPSWARADSFDVALEHDLGAATVRSRTRYAAYAKFYQNAFPGANNAAADTVQILAYNSATRRHNLLHQTDLRLTFDSGALRHDLVAGLELGRQTTDNLRNTGYFTSVGPNVTTVTLPLAQPTTYLPVTFRQSATDADNHSNAGNAALYLQDQMTLTPRWQLLAGLRYERFEVDFLNRRSGTRIASADRPLSPRAALVYKPLPALSLYASYSQAFVPRAGEQLSSLTPSNQAFDPERFQNHELGVKWDDGAGFSASAALYRLLRSNVVVTDPNDTLRSLLVDGQRSRGLELEAKGQLAPGWSVAAAYAWQDALLTASQSAAAPAGARVAHVPRHSLSLWSRHDFDPAWGAALGLVARSAFYASASNTVSLPGFTRFDGALYYQFNHAVRFQLNVENILDKKYYASAHSNDNIAPGSPRALRVTLHSQF